MRIYSYFCFMDKPLNLKLDEEIIAFAKKYAHSKGMSLSKYIEEHFKSLSSMVQEEADLYQKYKVDRDFSDRFDYEGEGESVKKKDREILTERLRKKHGYK